jgi:hypothetical protein
MPTPHWALLLLGAAAAAPHARSLGSQQPCPALHKPALASALQLLTSAVAQQWHAASLAIAAPMNPCSW